MGFIAMFDNAWGSKKDYVDCYTLKSGGIKIFQ